MLDAADSPAAIGSGARAPAAARVMPPGPRAKARRRPWLFALMAALVAAGGLLGAYAFTSIDNTQEVLVVADDVARGAAIEAGDVAVVRLSVDPALTPVAAGEQSKVVGTRAAVDLWAGTLLTESSLTESVVPVAGESLVGVSLTSAQMPSEQLFAGDDVRLVLGADKADTRAVDGSFETIDAVVVGVRSVVETGSTVVDVTVPADRAAELAAVASLGGVALVLDSREK
ncbi:hypothetical protein GCM10023339_41210 [Alloalcanivorax gelatiniphagus]